MATATFLSMCEIVLERTSLQRSCMLTYRNHVIDGREACLCFLIQHRSCVSALYKKKHFKSWSTSVTISLPPSASSTPTSWIVGRCVQGSASIVRSYFKPLQPFLNNYCRKFLALIIPQCKCVCTTQRKRLSKRGKSGSHSLPYEATWHQHGEGHLLAFQLNAVCRSMPKRQNAKKSWLVHRWNIEHKRLKHAPRLKKSI